MQDFAGRVAVVTGGASGIGLGLARRFGTEGMRVVIGDIEAGPLDAAVAELRDAGVEVEGVVTDVSDAAQVQALADAAVARFGGVHVVCNNAGVASGGFSWETPVDTWEWVLGVNLWGVINGIRSFVPLLVQQDAGYVVNTASVAGLVAGPFMGPYNASKHAVVALSETLLHELAIAAPHVHVSVLCPGWVNTRIGESDRNRPDRLTGELGREVGPGPGLGLLQGVLERGMTPAAVAEQVVDAVRADRFWILTHDREAESWVDAVNRRARSLIDRTNPAFGVPL